MLSIESQIRELKEFARSQHLEVEAVISESSSAKAPGRKMFGKLMDQVSKRKASGIICWKLDRLARNPVDGGAVIWAVEEGAVRDIATPQRTFRNTGNDKFWMQLEFGMAKKYVDDLSDNVKRGNRAKLEQGWLPGPPPLGYLNDRSSKTIIPDPNRFPLVRKMWDLVLRGESPPRTLKLANDTWGLRTRRYRRIGDRPLARSTLYKMLCDPFYCGLIIRKGESFQGAHKPMITKDEFDAVQRILRRPNRYQTRKHLFAYTGLIRCGECGAAVTASYKINRFGSHYVYYHCTKRRSRVVCRQKTIRVEVLEAQVRDILGSIQISKHFRDWALKHLRQVHTREAKVRGTKARSLDSAYRSCQKQLDALTDLRLRDLVNDEEFSAKRRTLTEELLRLREHLQDSDNRAVQWLELTERAFVFANLAKKRFQEGGLEEKRAILVALGSNLVLQDRILRIQLQKPFLLMQKGSSGPAWWGVVDGIRTFFVQHPSFVQWPPFCGRMAVGANS